MIVDMIKENSDGSADFILNLSDQERSDLVRYAVMQALLTMVKEGNKYEPSEAGVGDTERGESNSVHGSGEQSREPEQYDLFPETLEVSHKA